MTLFIQLIRKAYTTRNVQEVNAALSSIRSGLLSHNEQVAQFTLSLLEQIATALFEIGNEVGV
jgi:hypothetical protein